MRLLFLYLMLSFSAYAEEKQSVENTEPKDGVTQLGSVSKLDSLLSEMGLDRKVLTLKDLVRLESSKKGFLYRDTCDIDVFYTLKDFYHLFSINGEKDEFESFLLEKFKSLQPLKSAPKNWGQAMVKASGGALGLTMECLLKIGNQKTLDKMTTHLIEVDDVEKMKILWSRIGVLENSGEYKNFISSKISKTNSKFLKSLLDELLKDHSTKKD